jgi:predicted Zn finger-like uncharacterized protein
MQVVCSACSARYTIADDKIPVQGARVRCRKCQAVFSIDRGPEAPPAPAELPLIPPTPQAAADPFAPPAPSFSRAPEPPPPAPAAPVAPPPPPPLPPEPAPSEFERVAPAFSGGAPTAPQSGVFTSDRAVWPASDPAPSPPAAAPFTPPAATPFAPQAAPFAPPPAASLAPPPAASPAPPPVAQTSEQNVGIPAGLSEAERLKHERARRLARVLASDIAIYNKEKRERGAKDGNLVAVLGYEIKKSWEVYKERVTPELANSTPYFRDALNEMLAEGKKVF